MIDRYGGVSFGFLVKFCVINKTEYPNQLGHN